MASVKAAIVIRHSNKVIIDGFRSLIQSLDERSHVKALDREIHMRVILLLTCDLRVHVTEHTASVGDAPSRLEPFELDNKDLWRRIDLQLLRDVAVLLANVAVPLVVTR